jgi:predicted Rdx family selenoprotein
MLPIEFSIRYSVAEGYELEALALARRLFAVYDTGIDSLSLVPTVEEWFALYFNGRLVSSQQRDGRAPAVADVRALFRREGITVVRRPGPEEDGGCEELAARR